MPVTAEPTTAVVPCTNCGSDRVADYCAHCGQDQRDVRVSLGTWLAEALAEATSLDNRLFVTLRMLLRRPGALTAEWLEGRRARYIHPLRLYLAALALLFASSFAIGFPPDLFPASGTLRGSGVRQYDMAMRAFQNEVRLILTIALAAVVPLMAATLRLAYARRSRVFIEHLVFSLHVNTFALLAFTAAWPAAVVGGVWGYLAAALAVLPIVHLWLAIRRAYGDRPLAATMRVALVQAVAALALLGGLVQFGEFVSFRLGVTMAHVDEGLRARANLLYREWAAARAEGDLDRAASVLPEALAVARAAGHGDDPHHGFHLAELTLAAGDPAGALSTAHEILDVLPTDLLSLGIAAEAAEAMGDDAAAAAFRGAFRALYPEHHVAQRDQRGHGDTFDRYAERAGG